MVYYELFIYLFYSLKSQHRITQRTSFSAKADNKKKKNNNNNNTEIVLLKKVIIMHSFKKK